MLFNQVAFPVPQATKDSWITKDPDSNAGLFDPVTPVLILPFYPDEFAISYDRQEEPGFIDGFSSVTYKKSAVRYGFELTSKESAIAAYYCLKELQETSEATNPFTPVICYDYALPDRKDLAQGYSVRQGFILVQVNSGTMRDEVAFNSSRRLFGWRLIFKEKETR